MGCRGASQDWGRIWARAGEVTHRMKLGFGEAGEGNLFLRICPTPSIVFSAAAVLPGTLDGDIDDGYTTRCAGAIYPSAV